MENSRRSLISRPTRKQLEVLIDFFEKHPDCALGHLRDPLVRRRSRQLWRTISHRLNNIGGPHKTIKQWQRYWSDKKNAVKKIAVETTAFFGSVDNVSCAQSINDLDYRIIAILAQRKGSIEIPQQHKIELSEVPSSVSLECETECVAKEDAGLPPSPQLNRPIPAETEHKEPVSPTCSKLAECHHRTINIEERLARMEEWRTEAEKQSAEIKPLLQSIAQTLGGVNETLKNVVQILNEKL